MEVGGLRLGAVGGGGAIGHTLRGLWTPGALHCVDALHGAASGAGPGKGWRWVSWKISEDLGRSRKVLEYLGISWYFKAVKDLYFYTILPGPWWSWMWRCVTVAKMRYNMVQLYEQDDLQRRSAEFSHDNIIQHPRQIVAQSKLDLLIWIPTFPTTILLYYLLLSHLTVLLKDACCVHLSRCLSHTEHTVIEKHRFEVYRWSLINPSQVFLLQCVLGHSALLPYRQQGHHHGHHNEHVFFIRILWRQQSHPQSLHGSCKLDWTWHGNLGVSYSNCKVYPCIMTFRNGKLNKMKVWVSICLNGNIIPDTVSVCISEYKIIEHPIIIGTYSDGMFLIETIEGLITAEARETRRQSRLDSLVFEQLGFIHDSFSTDVKSHDFLLPRFRSIVEG